MRDGALYVMWTDNLEVADSMIGAPRYLLGNAIRRLAVCVKLTDLQED